MFPQSWSKRLPKFPNKCPICWVSHMFSIRKHRYSYGICFGPVYALQNSTPNILSFLFSVHTRRVEKVHIQCSRSWLYIYTLYNDYILILYFIYIITYILFLYYIIYSYIIFYYIILLYYILLYFIFCYILYSFYLLYYIILFFIILYYIICLLYYIILYHIILYYIIM